MFVTRFAPSPTGLLHLGHAFSALTAFDAARAAGGILILRIEDTDTARCRPHFESAILDDLAWLGVAWEGPVRRQSEQMTDYAQALRTLIDRALVYRCFKTRKDLALASAQAPHERGDIVRAGPLPADEEAARLARGEAFAWRLWLDRARDYLGSKWGEMSFIADGERCLCDPARLGDAILARKAFPASYHLSSVHDDALAGVTHIIRGDDLRDAAHLHVLLQTLLDYPHPDYRHHRLILGADGTRLAKRDAAQSLQALRQAGARPADIRAMLGL
jgi:glutamyl-Q tRNA(Asp) synthetase